MSYTKQTWNTGDVITAEKLNHMEDGIGGCVLVVPLSIDTMSDTLTPTCEVPYTTVKEALTGGTPVLYHIIVYQDNALVAQNYIQASWLAANENHPEYVLINCFNAIGTDLYHLSDGTIVDSLSSGGGGGGAT